jgi:hypothetical protein
MTPFQDIIELLQAQIDSPILNPPATPAGNDEMHHWLVRRGKDDTPGRWYQLLQIDVMELVFHSP